MITLRETTLITHTMNRVGVLSHVKHLDATAHIIRKQCRFHLEKHKLNKFVNIAALYAMLNCLVYS